MLCLVMRLYPTFPPPGLLSTFVRRVPNNVPVAACRSFNLGSTTSETHRGPEEEQNNDFAFRVHRLRIYESVFSLLSCLEAEAL